LQSDRCVVTRACFLGQLTEDRQRGSQRVSRVAIAEVVGDRELQDVGADDHEALCKVVEQALGRAARQSGQAEVARGRRVCEQRNVVGQ
jgi:hypothetical protein